MPVGEYNLPLMNKVMDKIEAEPDLHDQAQWAKFETTINGDTAVHLDATPADLGMTAPTCGTAFCFAGHAVYEAGHKIKWQVAGYEFYGASYDVEFAGDRLEDGRHIQDVARQELGLNMVEAAALFAPNQTRGELRELVDAANNGESLVAVRARQIMQRYPTD